MSNFWRVVPLTRDPVRVTHFRTRKATSLFAYLLLHPGRHTHDYLIYTFWPDADFDAARASFRVALSHIRKELGDNFLEAGRDTVTLAASFTCNMTKVEQAVKAKRWNDWILARRERLEELVETVVVHASPTTVASLVNLPPEPNRFFGREDEIQQMADLLTGNRQQWFRFAPYDTRPRTA